MEEGLDMGAFEFEFNHDDFNPNGTDDNDNLLENEDNGTGLEEDGTEEQDNGTEDEGSEEVGTEDDDKGEGSETDTSSNIYSSLAAVIHENGLLPSIDIEKEEIKSIDDFTRIMKVEQTKQAQILLQEYIDNLDVASMAQNNSLAKELESVDEDYLKGNIEYAKTLILEDYKNQGVTDERAHRIVNRLAELGDEDVINEAMSSRNALLEIHTKAIQTEQAAFEKQKAETIQRQAQIQDNIKKSIYDTEMLIEGYKPTPVFRDQVYKLMTEVVGNDPNGQPENKFMADRREDPVAFESRMYMAYALTNGFKDIKNLGAPAKSKAVQELDRVMRSYKPKDNSTPAYMQDNQSYAGTDFELNI